MISPTFIKIFMQFSTGNIYYDSIIYIQVHESFNWFYIIHAYVYFMNLKYEKCLWKYELWPWIWLRIYACFMKSDDLWLNDAFKIKCQWIMKDFTFDRNYELEAWIGKCLNEWSYEIMGFIGAILIWTYYWIGCLNCCLYKYFDYDMIMSFSISWKFYLAPRGLWMEALLIVEVQSLESIPLSLTTWPCRICSRIT